MDFWRDRPQHNLVKTRQKRDISEQGSELSSVFDQIDHKNLIFVLHISTARLFALYLFPLFSIICFEVFLVQIYALTKQTQIMRRCLF